MSTRKNAKEAPKKTAEPKVTIEQAVAFIKPPNLQTVQFTITGTAPLIVHRWSEKAKKQILDNEMGIAAGPRQPKNPQEDYEASLYRLSDDSYGFPAVAFKNAGVRACKLMKIQMTDARQLFHVRADDGDLVRIIGTPTMREDMVKVPPVTGNASIRYRGEFKEWSAVLTVVYNANILTRDQVLSIFEHAGFSVGVGEWRVECDGIFGTWTLLQGGE
jgi:hypothetical protein